MSKTHYTPLIGRFNPSQRFPKPSNSDNINDRSDGQKSNRRLPVIGISPRDQRTMTPPFKFYLSRRTSRPTNLLFKSTSKEEVIRRSSGPSWNKNFHPPSSQTQKQSSTYKSPRSNSQRLKYPFKRYEDKDEITVPSPSITYQQKFDYINVLQRRNLVPSVDIIDIIPSSLYGMESELEELSATSGINGPMQRNQWRDPVADMNPMKKLSPSYPSLPYAHRRIFPEQYHSPEEQRIMQELAGEDEEYNRNLLREQNLKRRNKIRAPPVNYQDLEDVTEIVVVDGVIFRPSQGRPAPEENSFGRLDDLRKVRLYDGGRQTLDPALRRRWYTHLPECFDDEISFSIRELDRILMLHVYRPPTYDQPGLFFDEKIALPRGVSLENLRVVKDPFGTLLIEEAWEYR